MPFFFLCDPPTDAAKGVQLSAERWREWVGLLLLFWDKLWLWLHQPSINLSPVIRSDIALVPLVLGGSDKRYFRARILRAQFLWSILSFLVWFWGHTKWCLRITSGGAQGTLWDARAWTWVNLVLFQVPHPLSYLSSPALVYLTTQQRSSYCPSWGFSFLTHKMGSPHTCLLRCF